MGSYLVLVTVENKAYLPVYQSPALSPASQRSFQPGPGEAHLLQSVSLHFEGVIFVEGHLLRSVGMPPCTRREAKHRFLAQVYPREGITYSSRLATLVRYKGSLGLMQMEKTSPVFREIMILGAWTSITFRGLIAPMVWMIHSLRQRSF